jgi:hypothetical protein
VQGETAGYDVGMSVRANGGKTPDPGGAQSMSDDAFHA